MKFRYPVKDLNDKLEMIGIRLGHIETELNMVESAEDIEEVLRRMESKLDILLAFFSYGNARLVRDEKDDKRDN